MFTPVPLRISAKGLGDALPGACPRCLWVSLRFDLPHQRFPGFFNAIDRFLKTAVHRSLDDTGRLGARRAPSKGCGPPTGTYPCMLCRATVGGPALLTTRAGP